MFSKIHSLTNKYTCAQVYCTDFDWTRVYPMKSKSEAHYTLDMVHQEFGAFRVMIPDNAKELTEGAFRDKLRRAGTVIAPVEAYSPNQNRAESAIRELKRMYRRTMIATKAPEGLWDHCFQLMSEIRSHTALNLMRLGGETPTTYLTGETADISHLCQFGWYDYVWWLDVTDKLQNKKLGHYLGPSLNSGDAMCSKILTSKATTRVYSSVFPLSTEDRNSEVVKAKIAEYETELAGKLRDRAVGLEPIEEDLGDIEDETPEYDVYHDEDENKEHEMPEIDEYDHGFFDKYIAASVMIPDPDGVLRKAKVNKRKRDDDGNVIGKSHSNPILDTSLYEIEFDDGSLATYTANIIAENLYEQVDDEGRTHVLFDSITDHKKGEDAICFEDGFVELNGRKHPKQTTRGWKLCVLWKDGTTCWVPLKDLKESHPIQVAEYAVAHELTHEPAFAWWVSQVLKRRNRIISAAQTRYARTDQKFGIELPHTIQRALEIDRETGTTFWQDAIRKEMNTVFPAFEILEDGAIAPVGFQKIPCHLIFDIKMDLTRKARFVAGGHKTEPPASITYASVVSRESVRIAFLIAALNGLDILTADVQGAYLNAPCREKVYTVCGPEFGIHRGRIAVIRLALYGLKSSGFAWRSHLAET
jgi:Reverse transcriptase (RNA-dependent DNA polymerase)